MAIRYLSFDFDGCLFNRRYVRLPHNNFTKNLGNAVLDTNRPLLDQLKKENAQFSSVHAFIGSTRQDYPTDQLNGVTGLKGSCLPAMVTVCAYLGVNLDPFMLADIEGNLESGTSFNRIIDEIKNNTWSPGEKNIHKHAVCPSMDEYKRTILFAQMQKAAADNPNEEIIFDFFDDRLDILASLERYFTRYPHMIPKNVRLRLHAYAGQDVCLKAEIPGAGNPISNYRFCIKKMHKNVDALDEIAEILEDVALPSPEEKILSVMKEVVDQGLFIHDVDKVEAFLASSDATFVAHPSKYKADGLFTFTTSCKTSKSIAHIRYGIDLNGELFLIDTEQKVKVEILPEGLLATLTEHIERAKQYVEMQAPLDKPVVQKVSKGQALYQEIIENPYFVADADQAKEVLKKHPHFPFVIRKSGTKVEGMLTFTTVYDTDKGIIHTRYGINDKGKLFTLDSDSAYKIEKVSTDLLGTLVKHTLAEKERINQAKSLEDITFEPHQNTADTEKEPSRTNRLFVVKKGFFAPSAKPQPKVTEHTPGFDGVNP